MTQLDFLSYEECKQEIQALDLNSKKEHYGYRDMVKGAKKNKP
jgi:hypothetical protein